MEELQPSSELHHSVIGFMSNSTDGSYCSLEDLESPCSPTDLDEFDQHLRQNFQHFSDVKSNCKPVIPAPPSPPPLLKVPPPPPINNGLLPAVQGLNGEAKTTKLRRFNWEKIPSHQVVESLWEKAPFQLDVDFRMIDHLFTVQHKEPIKRRSLNVTTSTQEMGVADRDNPNDVREKICILDSKRSFNVNIFLRQIKRPTSALIESIRACDVSFMNFEKLQAMRKLLPSNNELKDLQNYKESSSYLDTADLFLYQIISIPFYTIRIDAILLKEEFDRSMAQITRSISTLQKAVNEIRRSNKLPTILKLVLQVGNHLNRGVLHGHALGFKLTSLKILHEMKSNKPGISLLHLLAMEIKRNNPEMLHWMNEIPSVDLASRISEEEIMEDISNFETRVTSIKQKINNEAYDELKEKTNHFLENAQLCLHSIRTHARHLTDAIYDLTTYFCEKLNSFSVSIYFQSMAVFCKSFQKAVKENADREVADIQRESGKDFEENKDTRRQSKSLTMNTEKVTAANDLVNNRFGFPQNTRNLKRSELLPETPPRTRTKTSRLRKPDPVNLRRTSRVKPPESEMLRLIVGSLKPSKLVATEEVLKESVANDDVNGVVAEPSVPAAEGKDAEGFENYHSLRMRWSTGDLSEHADCNRRIFQNKQGKVDENKVAEMEENEINSLNYKSASIDSCKMEDGGKKEEGSDFTLDTDVEMKTKMRQKRFLSLDSSANHMISEDCNDVTNCNSTTLVDENSSKRNYDIRERIRRYKESSSKEQFSSSFRNSKCRSLTDLAAKQRDTKDHSRISSLDTSLDASSKWWHRRHTFNGDEISGQIVKSSYLQLAVMPEEEDESSDDDDVSSNQNDSPTEREEEVKGDVISENEDAFRSDSLAVREAQSDELKNNQVPDDVSVSFNDVKFDTSTQSSSRDVQINKYTVKEESEVDVTKQDERDKRDVKSKSDLNKVDDCESIKAKATKQQKRYSPKVSPRKETLNKKFSRRLEEKLPSKKKAISSLKSRPRSVASSTPTCCDVRQRRNNSSRTKAILTGAPSASSENTNLHQATSKRKIPLLGKTNSNFIKENINAIKKLGTRENLIANPSTMSTNVTTLSKASRTEITKRRLNTSISEQAFSAIHQRGDLPGSTLNKLHAQKVQMNRAARLRLEKSAQD